MRNIERVKLNLSGYDNYSDALIESAGTKIALSLYRAGDHCPCIVFIPGTMTHPLFYDDFLALLAGSGFNVAGVHLLSHGKSPREKKLYSFADMVQNVRDTVTYCIDNISKDVIVMGSSQGGILSLAAACTDQRIKAVFPHNILIPGLKNSISVTSFPKFLKPFNGAITSIIKFAAKMAPGLQVPVTFYLEFDRITSSKAIRDLFYADPLGLTSYPLQFLASLFSANLSGISDGSIKCPVVVIASTGDRLFSYDYCLEVYGKIAAPHKEMLVFNEPYHLIFNECPERIIGPIVQKLKEYQ
jgi:alpha-beta hydrolase superfamily lysophospholipase